MLDGFDDPHVKSTVRRLVGRVRLSALQDARDDVVRAKAVDPSHASLFQTGWFVESPLTQTLIIHIIRTTKVPFVQTRTESLCAHGAAR